MRASLPRMIGYGFGECAYSLVLNSLCSFAMLYYTAALGLSPALAGAALAVSLLVEVVIDPAMGYVSDRTRHRFGRRHPWMFAGGVLMAVCFYYLWAVPLPLHGRSLPLFAYLVFANLLLRAGLTLFFVPYLALGFELCPDHEGGSKLQAVRQVMNIAANLAGPALAWSLFLRDTVGPHGVMVPGASVPQNFVHMGSVFSLAALLCVLLAIGFTRGWAVDNRSGRSAAGRGAAQLCDELRRSVENASLVRVLALLFLAGSGMVWVSTFQPYVYVYFMGFEPWQKTVAHGSTMIGMAVGGVLSACVARGLSKKSAVLLGGAISLLSNGALAALFLTGWVPVGTVQAFACFVPFHAAFWLGNGVLLPSGVAMVAELSARYHRETGRNGEGVYAALFSLTTKISMAFALAGSGWVLRLIGFNPCLPQGSHACDAVWRLGLAMVLVGPLMTAAALAVITPLKDTREARS